MRELTLSVRAKGGSLTTSAEDILSRWRLGWIREPLRRPSEWYRYGRSVERAVRWEGRVVEGGGGGTYRGLFQSGKTGEENKILGYIYLHGSWPAYVEYSLLNKRSVG